VPFQPRSRFHRDPEHRGRDPTVEKVDNKVYIYGGEKQAETGQERIRRTRAQVRGDEDQRSSEGRIEEEVARGYKYREMPEVDETTDTGDFRDIARLEGAKGRPGILGLGCTAC
jgi:hypothetical protein